MAKRFYHNVEAGIYNIDDLSDFLDFCEHGQNLIFTEEGNATVHPIDLEDLQDQVEDNNKDTP